MSQLNRTLPVIVGMHYSFATECRQIQKNGDQKHIFCSPQNPVFVQIFKYSGRLDYVTLSHSDQTLTMSRDLLEGRTIAEWISRLDPSLGQFTLETPRAGLPTKKRHMSRY